MERCIFVFLFGLLAFNWPFLEMFQQGPVRYLYGMWLGYIVILALVVHRPRGTKKPAEAVGHEGKPS